MRILLTWISIKSNQLKSNPLNTNLAEIKTCQSTKLNNNKPFKSSRDTKNQKTLKN